jgi:hypothetical protein
LRSLIPMRLTRKHPRIFLACLFLFLNAAALQAQARYRVLADPRLA